MRIYGFEMSWPRWAALATVVLPTLLRTFIGVGGDVDFLAGLVGWANWKSDMLALLTTPPAWALILYVTAIALLLAWGERLETRKSVAEVKRLVFDLEGRLQMIENTVASARQEMDQFSNDTGDVGRIKSELNSLHNSIRDALGIRSSNMMMHDEIGRISRQTESLRDELRKLQSPQGTGSGTRP